MGNHPTKKQPICYVPMLFWLQEQKITRKLLKIHQFGTIPFWPQEQLKLLSIVNAKFTLITLSKYLLYGTAHCNTQELECETINIIFISCNNKQSGL